jgi:glycosyltransferase involved in cell wall biosynthesis
MNDPLISIVVPAYNYARFLGDCIGGLLSQTYQNWELLVVDNGSTDETPEVLARYTDPRIRRFRIEENRGPVQAWKLGYEESRGDYFAILPADDMFLPEKLQRQVEFLRANPGVGAVGTYIQEIDDDGVVQPEGSFMVAHINQPIDYSDLKNWRWKHHLCIPTALYARALCEQAGAVPSEGLTNICDWDFHIRLLGIGTKMAVIPEVLTSYRWHGSNTSKKRGDAFLQWTFSHVKNYVPILRRIAPDPRKEIQECLYSLYLCPAGNYFVENVPRNQLCAMLEALLDPEGGLETFPDYEAFRRYAETWMVDSDNRAALAAVVEALVGLRERLLASPLPPAPPDSREVFPLELRSIELDRVNASYAELAAKLEAAAPPQSCRWALVYAAHMLGRKGRSLIRGLIGSEN